MDWGIHEIARISHTTSRTLRHYDAAGLVPPSRVGANGYRYYDRVALVRLQRVLMLRELGLGIPAIAEMLSDQGDDATAIESHLVWLQREQERIARQMASVTRTIDSLRGKEQVMEKDMPTAMFDGFDNTEYRDEVEQRWGRQAAESSDTWWRSLNDADRADFGALSQQLMADWRTAAARGLAADGDEAQQLARRQAAWLASIPGTPKSENGGPAMGYVLGLGELYVADERFGANYGGEQGAAFVRDALRIYAERELT